jgi:hypothetical protein
VSGDDDDEALTWAGGRDPSHYETPEPKAPKPGKASRASTAPAGGAVAGSDEDAEEVLPAPMSAAVLVCLGVLGGIYALYTLGWIVSWQRLLYVDTDALELAAFHVQQVLAILAPPLWFVATIFFTRDRRSAVRLLWLIIGALLLVPWSFTFGQ